MSSLKRTQEMMSEGRNVAAMAELAAHHQHVVDQAQQHHQHQHVQPPQPYNYSSAPPLGDSFPSTDLSAYQQHHEYTPNMIAAAAAAAMMPGQTGHYGHLGYHQPREDLLRASSSKNPKAPLAKHDREKEYDFRADVEALRTNFPNGPWDKLDMEEIVKRRKAFFEMTREQRDFFMFGMLSVLDGGDTTRSRRLKNSKRKNMHTFYCFDHNTPISRDLFLAIYGVSKKYLDNLRKQMKDKGLKSRELGYRRRRSPSVSGGEEGSMPPPPPSMNSALQIPALPPSQGM